MLTWVKERTWSDETNLRGVLSKFAKFGSNAIQHETLTFIEERRWRDRNNKSIVRRKLYDYGEESLRQRITEIRRGEATLRSYIARDRAHSSRNRGSRSTGRRR
jgi:hypothetical protein